VKSKERVLLLMLLGRQVTLLSFGPLRGGAQRLAPCCILMHFYAFLRTSRQARVPFLQSGILQSEITIIVAKLIASWIISN
jgi:hypothetical protein